MLTSPAYSLTRRRQSRLRTSTSRKYSLLLFLCIVCVSCFQCREAHAGASRLSPLSVHSISTSHGFQCSACCGACRSCCGCAVPGQQLCDRALAGQSRMLIGACVCVLAIQVLVSLISVACRCRIAGDFEGSSADMCIAALRTCFWVFPAGQLATEVKRFPRSVPSTLWGLSRRALQHLALRTFLCNSY